MRGCRVRGSEFRVGVKAAKATKSPMYWWQVHRPKMRPRPWERGDG